MQKFYPDPPKGSGKRVEEITNNKIIPGLLNVTQTPCKDIRGMVNCVGSCLAAGEPVSETKLYDRTTGRYRKGDCLKALRIVHARFPRYSRLVLESGIYTLYPVTTEGC